jgi:predicted  nucleic acid-binding Zn-ribbon protein
MAKRNLTSQCSMCGRIYWEEERERCPKCGGLCAKFLTNDTPLLERRRLGGDRSATSAVNDRS